MARTGIIRRAVAVGATVLALIGSSGGAAADAGTQAPPANVVEVSSTDTGFTAPDTASPGVAQFRMVTTSEGSGWIGLARLNDGVSWEMFRANLAKTVSDTPADVVAGSAALAESATLLGGVVIHPGLPGAFTQLLHPGRYVLFDYRFLAPTDARYRFLTVTGSPGYSPLDFSGTLVATSVPGVGPRFSLLGEVRAGQPLLLHNAMPGQLVEAVAFPIAGDVTEARLAEWFASFRDGDPAFPPNAPFDIAQGRGMLPLSPGWSTVVSVPLTQGRWVVVNWLKDAKAGTRLVKQGHYFVVDVR